MLIAPVSVDEAETRDFVRTYMSLPATLCCGGVEFHGEIRNLSEFGALVEGVFLPGSGSSVTVVRGDNAVEGVVAWHDGKRCGVRFRDQVSVRGWLSPVRPASDALAWPEAREIPSSTRSTSQGVSSPEEPRESVNVRLLRDLTLISRLVDDLGEELTSDAVTTEKHLGKLQNLDVAIQMLAAVCWELTEGKMGSTEAQGSIASLRKCSEATVVLQSAH